MPYGCKVKHSFIGRTPLVRYKGKRHYSEENDQWECGLICYRSHTLSFMS